jgi:hypothetical protein
MITLDFNEIYKLYETEKKTNYNKLKNEYNKLDVLDMYEIIEIRNELKKFALCEDGEVKN